MLCKRTPIEETCEAMRRHCDRMTEHDLLRLCHSLGDKVVETESSDPWRWTRWLPWESRYEWRLRELLALRVTVVGEIFDRTESTISQTMSTSSHTP